MTDGIHDTERGDVAELGYTEAMEELEAILEQLERPDVDIDVLADLVQRAAELIAHCRSRLESARLRVTEIVADLDVE